MWPYVFGDSGVRTYSVLYALSMLIQFALACWLTRRMKLPIYIGVLLGLAYAVGMVVGAKLLFDLLQHNVVPSNYLSPSYYLAGGLFGGPLAYLAMVTPVAIVLAKDRRRALDLIALTLPIPMIVAKLACVANGCCYGRPSDLPWAITFADGAKGPVGVACHPTQLFEIAALLVVFVIFTIPERLASGWRPQGSLLPWFVFIYGLGRPLADAFRGDDRHLPYFGPLSPSQAICLAASAIAGTFLIWQLRKAPLRGAYDPS